VIIILGVFAGLRVGEISNLRLHDIVDHGKSVDINIPEDIGKQEESRIIYLWKAPSMFVQRLMTIRLGHGAKESDTLIVTYRRWDKCVGKKMRSSNLDGLIKDLAEKAGIRKPRITMHMLRATHVEDLRRIQGYDIAAIAKRVGHKDISTTGRYMPDRERIRKTFPSLHVYWIDFINTLTGGEDGSE
jgi:integrase